MADYLRYADELETKQENEDEIIDTIVASMMRMNQRVFDKHRHATRDAHAKSHGVLIGEVTVYDKLPEYLAQGVFAKPETYPIVIRLSTAPGDIHRDMVPMPRGMAIKMLGVSGHQNNDLDALALLAHCYETGTGVDADLAQARKLYFQAASAGNSNAKRGLAQLDLQPRSRPPQSTLPPSNRANETRGRIAGI